MARLFAHLIGLRELGYLWSRAAGLDGPNRWISEWLATYLAYDYIKQCRRQEAEAWLEVGRTMRCAIVPRTTELNDFEEQYVALGVENYAWIQVAFFQKVAAVHEDRGQEFVEQLAFVSIGAKSLARDIWRPGGGLSLPSRRGPRAGWLLGLDLASRLGRLGFTPYLIFWD